MAESMITPTPEGNARFPVKRVEFTEASPHRDKLLPRIFALARKAIHAVLGPEFTKEESHE